MSISLSTLTNPATSDSVLLEAQSEADFLEPIVLFKNRATGSNAISNDATQTTANDQPLSLPLIKNPAGDLGGYLYIPDVSGNSATGPSVTIGANQTWEGELDMVITQWGGTSPNAYIMPMGGGDFVAGFGLILYPNGFLRVFSKGNPTSNYVSTSVILGATFSVKYGYNGTEIFADVNGVREYTATPNSQAVSITHPLHLAQNNNLIHAGNYAIQKAKLTVNSAVVFDCDFNGSTSIEDGVTSFEATTGGTVTINTGSGVDQARIVRRPKAVFNASEMDLVWDGPTGDYFFVSSLETGVHSGVLSLVNNASYEFAAFGIPRATNNRDGSQTLLAIFPNTISDSQKASLVTYAKTKSASPDWSYYTNLQDYYRNCNNLKSVDVRHVDVSNKNSISYFAFSASKLESLDASSWDTSNVTNVSVFAASCPELTSLNVNGWDTSNVTNFSYFVQVCAKLTSLDLTSWDTSSATNFSVFAPNSSQLTNVTVGPNCFSQGTCTNFMQAFNNTNLNQQSIDDILVALESAGTSNGTFDRTGGEYPSTTGVAAKNALQARGWSMTFSSEVLPSVLDLAPAAAYSLRALKSSQDPNVVRVRRSSDGTLSNFKASEVSDGTLTDWVNTDVDLVTPTLNNGGFEDGLTGWGFWSASADTNEFYAGTQSAKITVIGGGGAYIYKSNFSLQTGASYRVGFWAKISDASKQARVEFGSAANKEHISFTSTDWEYKEVTKTATAVTLAFSRQTGSGDYTVNFDNITITQLTSDGQVTTWYDQGGTNHAAQTEVAYMPLLVDAGTLVTEGGKPALDFDTGQQTSRLATSAAVQPSNINNFSLFTVQKAAGGVGTYGVRIGVPNNRLYLPYRSGGTNRFGYGDQLSAIDIGSPPTTHQLVSAIAGSTQGNAQAFVNGASQGSTALQDIAPTTNSVIFGSGPNNGSMQEVIMFHNDQSANRTAIETNINSHFTIYS